MGGVRTMAGRQILKEVDLFDFHSADAELLPDFLDNGALEMITHDGKHIKVYNLPKIIDGTLYFAQASHDDTFFEILNRLYRLGIISEELGVSFCEQIKALLKERGILVNETSLNFYNSPEICIVHYNEKEDQHILVFIPAYVTSAQYKELLELTYYYEKNDLASIVEIDFLITGWIPLPEKSEYDKNLELTPLSFREACNLLVNNSRIVDYSLPIEENPLQYDVPLSSNNFTKT